MNPYLAKLIKATENTQKINELEILGDQKDHEIKTLHSEIEKLNLDYQLFKVEVGEKDRSAAEVKQKVELKDK